ncbi:hypothetical protein ACFL2R_01640 [Patescibacteria group bacterium]
MMIDIIISSSIFLMLYASVYVVVNLLTMQTSIVLVDKSIIYNDFYS